MSSYLSKQDLLCGLVDFAGSLEGSRQKLADKYGIKVEPINIDTCMEGSEYDMDKLKRISRNQASSNQLVANVLTNATPEIAVIALGADIENLLTAINKARKPRLTPLPSVMSPIGSHRLIVAYCRVSTKSQDCSGQRYQIEKWLEERGKRAWYVEEIVSGDVPYEKRKLGMEVLPLLKNGGTLIVQATDRISRSMVDFNRFEEELRHMHVRLASVLENIDFVYRDKI